MTGHFEISGDFRATDRSQTCPYEFRRQNTRRGGSQTLPLAACMVRDLCRVVERENAAMGVLLALEPPTKGMLSEAASAGHPNSQLYTLNSQLNSRTYPKVQIFTVEDFFAGLRPDLPDTSDTLKKAKRITKPQTKPELGI